MANSGVPYDRQTQLKLYAPKEIEVTLVPLEPIEQAESSSRWASLFLAIFAALLGAWISLMAVDYGNTPFKVLLGVCVVAFGFLCFTFTQKGIKERRKARESSVDSTGVGKVQGKEELSSGAKVVVEIVRDGVFKDKEVLPLDEFEATIQVVWPDYNKAVLMKLCTDGIVTIEDASSGKPLVRFNKDFAVDNLSG